METTRSFNNKFEEKRFINHILENRYEKILILWGAQPLVEIVEWYQFVGLYHEASVIIKFLKNYTEAYY